MFGPFAASVFPCVAGQVEGGGEWGEFWSERVPVGTVTKRDLVDRVSTRTKLPKASVKLAVETLLEEMVQQLESGHRIEIRDFGVFASKLSAARVAKNPKTLEPVEVPPRAGVRFKAGSQMRARVQQGAESGGGGWDQQQQQAVRLVVNTRSAADRVSLNGQLVKNENIPR